MSKIRIAICAQSFGFGPVSKASSIAKGLLQKNPDIELIYVANSVSKEFFIREGLWNENRDFTIDSNEINKLDFNSFGKLNAAIVVIDPELATYFYNHVPVFFVDSLGFMWNKGFFDTYPCLKEVEAYFVQDVFGAYNSLKNKSIKNLIPVGAIIDTSLSKQNGHQPEFVFHLGGLINIFAKEPIEKYINGVSKIINKIGKEKQRMILTSQSAIEHFDVLKNTKIPTKDVSHKETLKIFEQSEIVFTSPGLTTLLEFAYLQVSVIPLPPQNLSQALIINNLVKQWNDAPEIWHFLAKNYPITEKVDEEEGVKQVQKLNTELLYDAQFQNDYTNLVEQIKVSKNNWLPLNIVMDFEGVRIIVERILKSPKIKNENEI